MIPVARVNCSRSQVRPGQGGIPFVDNDDDDASKVVAAAAMGGKWDRVLFWTGLESKSPFIDKDEDEDDVEEGGREKA